MNSLAPYAWRLLFKAIFQFALGYLLILCLTILYKEYKDQGFKMFAISTDDENSVAKVKPLVKSKGYNFPVLLDTNSDAVRLYYAQSIPYSVILNKKGMIIYSHLGYMRGDEVKVKQIIESEVNK